VPRFGGTAANRRIAVALSFDFDAESVWLGGLNTNTPSALSRGAYAANEGVPRVLKLLAEYGLPATFFIPGYTAEIHPNETKAIADGGFEIGHHGYLHEPPTSLTHDEERVMIERGIEALVEVTGKTPVGYRSPSWELSPSTFSLLAEYGITYDASQLGADRPYWVADGGKRTDIVEVPSAWELCDSAHFWFSFFPTYRTGLSAPSKVAEIWREDFAGAYEESGDICYVLTMHPELIGRHHRLRMLRGVLDYILERDNVWFATMGGLAEDFRVRSQATAMIKEN
jgi:peptidoglycan/xylan/chitin deacetylase (PgdA/CDA1 family)